ncbi:hypothetical protein MHJ94_11985 [Chryseobacterium taklimakanense]|uniref:hypothetical protein n=1 Tax=Chryseobacterium taklimakanense TaxID=536441 RepID=UPI001EF6E1BC|nr:hypothetical protein [Chryseobacterium taklimakanense]MCG7282008.1 hypothetical protein [Chryseobacterium taklimakanense]
MKTEYITTITESESFIFEGASVYIWDKFSSITDEKIEVTDPIYNQKYLFNIWKICLMDKLTNFAIGEFSNSIYGVYLVK